MRRSILLLVLLLVATAALAAGVDDAGQAKKSRRPKSTSRVITNEDVKKARGKVIELPGAAPDVVAPAPSLLERDAALRLARKAGEERVQAAESAVAQLEKQLADLERSYFEADDLDLRDTIIARQFDDASAKLAAARAELESARKALADLPSKP